MTMGEIIKFHRNRLNLSQEELGTKVGVNKAAVQKWESGRVQNMKRNTIQKLSVIFSVSPSVLMGLEEENITPVPNGRLSEAANHLEKYGIRPITKKRIPMLGNIACGVPIYAQEDRESYVEIGTDINADFCLRANGDSMINARIFDGDIVFVREQPMVNNGEIAAVIINDEATLKRVYYSQEQSKLVLQAENPKYEPFVYVGEELNQIRILGKAVAFQSDII